MAATQPAADAQTSRFYWYCSSNPKVTVREIRQFQKAGVDVFLRSNAEALPLLFWTAVRQANLEVLEWSLRNCPERLDFSKHYFYFLNSALKSAEFPLADWLLREFPNCCRAAAVAHASPEITSVSCDPGELFENVLLSRVDKFLWLLTSDERRRVAENWRFYLRRLQTSKQLTWPPPEQTVRYLAVRVYGIDPAEKTILEVIDDCLRTTASTHLLDLLEKFSIPTKNWPAFLRNPALSAACDAGLVRFKYQLLQLKKTGNVRSVTTVKL